MVTVVVCIVGALLGLLISGRHEHADEPEVEGAGGGGAAVGAADDAPTEFINVPRETPGRHRHDG